MRGPSAGVVPLGALLWRGDDGTDAAGAPVLGEGILADHRGREGLPASVAGPQGIHAAQLALATPQSLPQDDDGTGAMHLFGLDHGSLLATAAVRRYVKV